MVCVGPEDIPANFRLRPNAERNGTYAQFTWDSVDTSIQRVRGFFRGYRVTNTVSFFSLQGTFLNEI